MVKQTSSTNVTPVSNFPFWTCPKVAYLSEQWSLTDVAATTNAITLYLPQLDSIATRFGALQYDEADVEIE